MTLEELDKALEKIGLDLTNPYCQKVRAKMLELHGQTILDSKNERCQHCWHRENNRCSSTCFFHNLPENPVEASKLYLSKSNNIQLFPFLCLYFIPAYEELTGNKGLIEQLRQEFKRRYKKEYGAITTTAGKF